MDVARVDNHRRLLTTLEQLFEVSVTDLGVALSHAMDLVAAALDADKVDAFLYDPSRDSLVAVGTSNQPLSALQRKHGLDVLPLSNGGRVVHVFRTGETFLTGRLESDPEEVRGVKEALGIRSKLGVPLDVGGVRRGMMMIASRKPDFFTVEDARLAKTVARWVGVVAHRAELMQEIARNSIEQGRRSVAEELVTVLAHDLRNYLTPIKLRVHAIRRRAERDKRDADLQDADLALKALARLGSLVSEILDVARIDQGVFQMEPQPVDLVGLLEELVNTLSTPEHAIRLKAPEEVVVEADRDRVRQCLENLISNAIKHSPAGAAVSIFASRRTTTAGEMAQVAVVDEGPGVPSEILPRIFERFATGNGPEAGIGLGLYLAKRIAVMHGGDLTVESSSGAGARFVLTLRCCRAR